MKGPVIYIVVENKGDGYHLMGVGPIAWFFDKDEANKHADKLSRENDSTDFDVEECEAG